MTQRWEKVLLIRDGDMLHGDRREGQMWISAGGFYLDQEEWMDRGWRVVES